MIIIGITGTLGAGKGTVGEYLVSEYGFKHFSAREFIADEIVRRGFPVNRDTLTEVSNDIRAENHPGFILEQLYARALKHGGSSVIESVRTPGEIQTLKKKGVFYLLAVDADPKVRYERVILRKSATDQVSFDKFMLDEKREMESTDPNKQNIAACVKQADFVINNDGNLKDLHTQVDTIMKKLQA